MWGNGRDKKCLEWRRNRREEKSMGTVTQRDAREQWRNETQRNSVDQSRVAWAKKR